MIETNEGAANYEHTLNHHLEFFSKAGSAFEKGKSFYNNNESALSLFIKAWAADENVAMKLLFWVRNCRGGAGNRSGFRSCVKWLANTQKNWVIANIEQIPELGRWDDLKALYDTPVEEFALAFWVKAICEGNGLAAKWADRRDNKLIRYFRKNVLKEKEHKSNSVSIYRKLLVKNTNVVESKMCANEWNEIKYSAVPSVAMARYTKAFYKHDKPGYEKFKAALVKGEAKVNAGALFPHDCVRTVDHGDPEMADAQFAALKDYLEGTNQRIMVLADSSGSMSAVVGGSVRAIDVSKGLALYCSDRLGKKNPFYRKFMAFESESRLVSWEHMKFSQAVRDRRVFDGAVGSTRIDVALMTLLNMGKMFKAAKDQMPNVLLILSDMQFTEGASRGTGKTEVEVCLDAWVAAGYQKPKVIYWNLSSYGGSPATKYEKGVALVSGFSPSILGGIFQSKEFTPVAVMMKTLDKYNVVVPNYRKDPVPAKMFKVKYKVQAELV